MIRNIKNTHAVVDTNTQKDVTHNHALFIDSEYYMFWMHKRTHMSAKEFGVETDMNSAHNHDSLCSKNVYVH